MFRVNARSDARGIPGRIVMRNDLRRERQPDGMTDDLCLFALSETKDFGQSVATSMGQTLCAHAENEFDDGEHAARPMINVRAKDVYVVQSMYDAPDLSVNDKLCRLVFFCGALRDAAAARVTAVMPYLGYQRKDRKSQPRDPVTTRYLAGIVESVGVDGRVALIVDDMISTGTTTRRATEACARGGASAVYAAATHGVFVGNAPQILETDLLDGIFVSNTIPPFRLKGTSIESKLHVCDAAPRMAQAIEAIHSGGSVAVLNAIAPE